MSIVQCFNARNSFYGIHYQSYFSFINSLWLFDSPLFCLFAWSWQFLTLTESLKTMAYDPSWESCIGGGELRRGNLYIAAFGEFWGTAFLVFIGSGTTLGKGASWSDAPDPSIVQVCSKYELVKSKHNVLHVYSTTSSRLYDTRWIPINHNLQVCGIKWQLHWSIRLVSCTVCVEFGQMVLSSV